MKTWWDEINQYPLRDRALMNEIQWRKLWDLHPKSVRVAWDNGDWYGAWFVIAHECEENISVQFCSWSDKQEHDYPVKVKASPKTCELEPT